MSMTETQTVETSETNETHEKPDFSNYTWFAGTNDRFNAASVSTHEGRLYLGLKGYDKKSQGAGYIQAEFGREELGRLRDHLTDLLAGA